MTTASRGVVVVGSYNVDHVWQCDALPQPGQTLAGRYHSGAGGKGFNQAIAARRAGAEVTLLCALGADAGAAIARELAQHNGLTLAVRDSAQQTGTAGIYVDQDGRNSIVIGAGANAELDTDFVHTHHTQLGEAAVVLAQLETPQPAITTALQLARDAGAITILNPAPANAHPTAALLALAQILTPNETELAALFNANADTSTAVGANAIVQMPDESLHDLCRKLAPYASLVVTLGAAGCFISHAAEQLRGDDRPWYRVPAESVTAHDTTGAGDAFNGALAASLARGMARFRDAAQFASRYAALSTEHAGAAEAMPTRLEVQQRFQA